MSRTAQRFNPSNSSALLRKELLLERRNCMELFRDRAIEQFEIHTGSFWRPDPDHWSAIVRSPQR